MKNRRLQVTMAVCIATAALLLLAACREQTPEISTEAGDAGPTSATDGAADRGDVGAAGAGASSSAQELSIACGAVRFDGIPADPSSFSPLGDLAEEIDLSSIEGEREFFDTHDWFVANQSDDELVLFGVPHEVPDEGPRYANAEFTREGESWLPAGWGQCRIEVHAEGWGNARFVLDPDVEPAPASSTISVQAWEMNCASGEAPDGREVRPVVVSEDADSVSILVLVEPVQGGADCQGNPDFPLDIELSEPLGDRTVLDASVEPALRRLWPPTESSLSSQGLKE